MIATNSHTTNYLIEKQYLNVTKQRMGTYTNPRRQRTLDLHW